MSNKTIMTVAATALAAITIGCKSIPTDSQMYETSYACGAASGMVANLTKIDDTSRNAVVDIVNTVQYCVPTNGQTFSEAWTPIASNHVAKLVEEGKIDAGQGILITKTFNLAVNGIDYLFNVRYPKARTYQELVEAAVHGFSDGFLRVFKPANETLSSPVIEYDVEVYKYLQSKCK